MSLAKLAAVEGVSVEADVSYSKGPMPTDIYPGIIKLAYLGKSPKTGANSVTLHVEINKRMHRETLWVTSGTAKGCQTWYTAQDGSKAYLPGFNVFNALSMLTVGKHCSTLEAETKTVKLYSFEEKKEVPTDVEVITELLDQPIYAGLIRQIEDKNVQDSTGAYVPSGETRTINLIDKLFRASDKMTVAEAKAEAEEPVFYETWLNNNKGKDRDKSTKTAGTAGAPSPVKMKAGSAEKPATKSLFGG